MTCRSCKKTRSAWFPWPGGKHLCIKCIHSLRIEMSNNDTLLVEVLLEIEKSLCVGFRPTKKELRLIQKKLLLYTENK